MFLALFLITAGSALMAQNEESEKDLQKAMQAEEMKARKDMLEDQQQKMRQMEREYSEQARIMDRSARESSRFRSSGRTTFVNSDGPFIVSGFGQENQSQLTLRKSFRETTSTSKGEFDVESGIKHFRCMISGSVGSGEIFIGIEYPDGKTFKELVINASADINFSQSISVKEEDEKKYVGSWNYVIKADEAEGNYMVQIMTH